MPKVKFAYDLKKDVWSWVHIAKSKDCWGMNWRDEVGHINNELLEKIEKNSFAKAEKIVLEYIKNRPIRKNKNLVMYLEIRALEKAWKLFDKIYFTALEKITQKPMFRKEFTCYFTTGLMCPYSERENWFMSSMWHSTPSSIATICHEIMHLQFLHYYRKYLEKAGLNEEQIQDLKEALTFLLNDPVFDKIIKCDDNGYPAHQKLRKQLSIIWNKTQDFKILIDEGIKIIKKS